MSSRTCLPASGGIRDPVFILYMTKYKQKTHKGASKRFKLTATGKVLHRSQKIRHLKLNKSKRKQRALNLDKSVDGRMKTKIKKLLGKA